MNRVIDKDASGITTHAADEPDHDIGGGACHLYQVLGPDEEILLSISFQHGPAGDHGVNGVQHRHLLKIIEDRLRSFQIGGFSSTLNEVALSGVQAALAADAERTARRSLAGTEGQNKP